MNKVFNELIVYFKNPLLEKDTNNDFKYRIVKFFKILTFCLLTSYFFIFISNLFENFHLVKYKDYIFNISFKNIINLLCYIFIISTIEEIIFRAPLTLFKNKQTFKILFYLSAFVFAYIHFNYNITLYTILFSPLLVAPQFFAGLYYSFIRIKFGLIWSICLHITYNLTIFALNIFLF
ncbi:hypothetical protein C7448_102457 [Tenacibaculum gallaicum]|uniref:CAAX prenyl protease 2/Lysostaphin resistance protein A-like domain-containing protein n=1 Tax=Tenacibaculum gallaicum TaxID=561505 RepID=A0A3E0I843_9FLAO|nr:CPBP family intramembrane glutamic endopeptidase [Tenacibaculum gallaicum]REH54924.1 hypothetical protein C7448_102457 [Tenacibaculum gallaicum]